MIKKITDENTLVSCLMQFDSSTPVSISERVGDLNLYAKKLMKCANNFCYEKEERIVGFVSFYANDYTTYTAYLANIAVGKDYMKCGIGSQMLEFSMNNAKDQGMKYMELEVHKQNKNAISFYMKKNFKIKSDTVNESLFLTREL